MIIGLEVSTNAVRAVRLGRPRAGGAPQCIVLPLEAGRLPIAGLMESLCVRNAVWGVAIPSSWCFYRTIALPYNAPGRVAATFRYALEGRLPGSVEEYCINALSAPRAAGEKGCRLTVAACPKEKLRDLLAQLKEAGVTPCIAQPAVLALARRLRSAANALILRIGQEVELAVMQRGELVAADVFPLPAEGLDSPAGAGAFVERLRFALKAMELSWGEFALDRCILIARTGAKPCDAKPCEGSSNPSQGSHAASQPCEGLNEPSQGGDLRAALSRALAIPVEPPPEQLGDAAFAAAWGIATQSADKPHLALSLLQGEFAPPAHAQRYERRAAVALALAIGIVLLLGVHTLRGILAARALDHSGSESEAKLYGQVLPGVRGAPDLRKMKDELARLEKEAAGAGGGNRVSALARWTELLRLAPADVTLESVDITQKLITLRARAKERSKAWDLQRALARSPSLLPNSPTDLRTGEGNATTFSLEVKYK